MSRRVAARLADVDPSSRWSARELVEQVLLASAAAAAGFGIGPATAGAVSPAQPSRTATSAAPTPDASAPRTVAGVPEGFPHSGQGAQHAAIGFLQVEVSNLMADPDAYRAAWREMCTPAYYSSGGRAAAETVLANQESANHLLTNAAHGQRVYERVFPLTGWVVSDDADTATVRTWSLVVQHPGDGPTIVLFDAGTMQLRWLDGDWKLNGGSGSSSTADGASGPLRLDDGPGLPPYLAQPEVGDAAPSR